MKRIVTGFLGALLSALIIFASALTANCASEVGFSSSGASERVGRLISIDMSASSSGSLAAAVFHISYDPEVLEYRRCKSDNKVEVKAQRGSLCVSWLCDGGNSDGVIFTLCFKAAAEGDARFSYTVEDSVDFTPEPVSVGSCTAGAVRVTGGSRSSAQDSSSRVKETAPTTGSPMASAAKSQTEPESVEPTQRKSGGLINEAGEDVGGKRVLTVIFAGAGLMLAAATVVIVVRILRRKKKPKDNDTA